MRSAAAAVGIVLTLLYLMPMLMQMVPDPDWQRALYRVTPATAVQALATTVDNAVLPLGPWAALGVAAAWAAERPGRARWSCTAVTVERSRSVLWSCAAVTAERHRICQMSSCCTPEIPVGAGVFTQAPAVVLRHVR